MQSLNPGEPRAIGRYQVLGRLGRGGMGTVYLGEDTSGQRVAIKVINPDLAQEESFRLRFRHEAEAAQKVRRFCTAAVLEAALNGEQLYVVTEYVAGPSLEESVREQGPLRGSSLDALAVGVATALTAIHGAGIVHRDLKPSNVLLAPVGPRVIDFGIARTIGAAGGGTRTGQLIGTPHYMAPEVIAGEPVTQACDVFAWGCVVTFAGTGRTPFGGDSLPAAIHQLLNAEPNLDGLDPAMRDLVAHALVKDPRRRPTAQELLQRMMGSTYTPGEPTTRIVAGRPTPPPPPASHTPPPGQAIWQPPPPPPAQSATPPGHALWQPAPQVATPPPYPPHQRVPHQPPQQGIPHQPPRQGAYQNAPMHHVGQGHQTPVQQPHTFPSQPPGFPGPGGPTHPSAPSGRRSSGGRVVAALVAAVLGLAALGVGAVNLGSELSRGPTPEEQQAAGAQELAGRWKTRKAGEIFPESVEYLPSGYRTNQKARRIGISAQTDCAESVDQSVAGPLTQQGCMAVLRSTYVDGSGVVATTLGVAVMPDENAAKKARDEINQAAVPGGVKAVGFEQTATALFGDAQRQSLTLEVHGRYLVFAAAGYTDGRPKIDSDRPGLFGFVKDVVAQVQKGLTEVVPACSVKEVVQC
ncbi:serine/threonine-protein kinase [Rhizohabitans arisaemae]|uniref:serine/threonine-protein kinase n=1 Tax=Rhizohabitans arisaemae TaxID=2720610 RepID=UPI0024B234F0|nr:serine/threonine-protein kinase [Rhizohabitans arisaemae]